jgi:hypothetical protein
MEDFDEAVSESHSIEKTKSSTQTKIGAMKKEIVCLSGDLRLKSACLLKR